MKGIEIVVKCKRRIDQHDNDWFINNENWACTKKGTQANKYQGDARSLLLLSVASEIRSIGEPMRKKGVLIPKLQY